MRSAAAFSGGVLRAKNRTREPRSAGDGGVNWGGGRAPSLGLLEVLRPAAQKGARLEPQAAVAGVSGDEVESAAAHEASAADADASAADGGGAAGPSLVARFHEDALWGGRRFRTLNVLDEGVREGLAIEVDTSLPANRVIRVMERMGGCRDSPRALHIDNGPELLAREFVEWCGTDGIELRYIQSGKPDQNVFIERLNRAYREEVLDSCVFEDLEQVREIGAVWLRSYNEERPHEALRSLPPGAISRGGARGEELYF